jgi:hypothetical protein
VRPRDLVLYNTTHLKLRYRHTGEGGGAVFVELVLEDGSRIALSEGSGTEPPRGAGSGWWLPRAPGDTIVTRTLATSGLLFGSDRARHILRRPPLPLGRIAAVRIGLKGAAKGEGLDLFELSALRPSGNAVAPDGHLMLAGRVTRDGVPLPTVTVTAVSAAGGAVRKTATDADGLYFFTALPAGEPVYVAARGAGRRHCVPRASPIVDMRRNEAELDIDITDCREPPAAMMAGAGLTP